MCEYAHLGKTKIYIQVYTPYSYIIIRTYKHKRAVTANA